ncbi:hypothetical protein MWH28_02990 [Natroniella sulfidigena]|uniref:hypothetical protein n=1 Tax=Natroniella sulfidigena TaxID=723921 RepID=UPI00200B0507|nr:hypothetical protein [Natroniella sulfidigena]MCK8816329.1 hypothetical protein [Natroniella sulfidigena]
MKNRWLLVFILASLFIINFSISALAIEAPYYRGLLTVDMDGENIFEEKVRVNSDDDGNILRDEVFNKDEDKQYYIIYYEDNGESYELTIDEDDIENYESEKFDISKEEYFEGDEAIKVDINFDIIDYIDVDEILEDYYSSLSAFIDALDWDSVRIKVEEDGNEWSDHNVLDRGDRHFSVIAPEPGNRSDIQLFFRLDGLASFLEEEGIDESDIEGQIANRLGHDDTFPPSGDGTLWPERAPDISEEDVSITDDMEVKVNNPVSNIITNSNYLDLNNPGETENVYFNNDTQTRFLTIEYIDDFGTPEIEASFIDTGEVLSRGDIYYSDSIDLEGVRLDITDASPTDEITRLRYRMLHNDSLSTSIVGSRETDAFGFPIEPIWDDDDEDWNVEDRDWYDVSDWEIEQGVLEGYENDIIQAIRIGAETRGTTGTAWATYYFVLDEGEDTHISVEDEDGEREDELGVFGSRRPQLRTRIENSISGVGSRDDITVEYAEVDSETYNEEDLDFDNEMEVRRVEEDLDEDEDGNTYQTARFVPFDELGEGHYAVKIQVEDRAGNEFEELFHLEIDASDPRIHNPRFNGQLISGEDEINVSAGELELYFEAFGIQDMVYGIRHIDGEDNGDLWEDGEWQIEKDLELRHITQFVENDFSGKDDDIKGGSYQVFILGDESSIDPNDFNGIEKDEDGNIVIEDEDGFGNSIIDTEFDSDDATLDYVEFTAVVDDSAPRLKDGEERIYYIDDYHQRDGNIDNLDGYELYNEDDAIPDDDDDKTIYRRRPVFAVEFESVSAIEEIDIIFYRRGIYPNDARILDIDDDGVIYFEPREDFEEDRYSIEIEIEDEVGNRDEIELDDIFSIGELGTDAIHFSITDGEYFSNVNESSALEIMIDEESYRTEDKLEVIINGRRIVEEGEIVEDSGAEDNENRYRKDWDDGYYDDDYYFDDDFDASDFDIFFYDYNGNSKGRIVIFSRMPFGSYNEVVVRVGTEAEEEASNSVTFTVENYREGFGFGRLILKD